MFNKSQQSIITAFNLTDGHLHVVRRILNDMARHDLRLESTHSTIDYEWYCEQYNLFLMARVLVEWIIAMTGVGKAKIESTKLDLSTQDDFVFGGDYAKQTSHGEEDRQRRGGEEHGDRGDAPAPLP